MICVEYIFYCAIVYNHVNEVKEFINVNSKKVSPNLFNSKIAAVATYGATNAINADLAALFGTVVAALNAYAHPFYMKNKERNKYFYLHTHSLCKFSS